MQRAIRVLQSVVSNLRIRLRSATLRFCIRRLLVALPVMFGVTLLTFFILDVLPGNAAQQLLGSSATPEQVMRLEQQLHLDQPAWERYLDWLSGLLRGDLGNSLASGQPVISLLAGRIAVSFELVGYAFILSVGLAVPLALLAARWPRSLPDRIIMIINMAGLSVASYVLALWLVLLFAVHWTVMPAIGFQPLSAGFMQNLRSLTLPAVSITVPLMCLYTRFLRADLLEQMRGEDYIVTAIAKGAGPWRVLISHALRNSLLGLLTLVGLNVGTLISGTVVIEQIFALPGIGQLLFQSINTRDAALVQAIVLLMAVIALLATLVADLLCAVLDPRIQNEQH
jgi:peptide/nickel transport system permease protein